MRRILQGLCAFVFLFALAFPLQDVSAKPRYFDKAQNYLVWNTGPRNILSLPLWTILFPTINSQNIPCVLKAQFILKSINKEPAFTGYPTNQIKAKKENGLN